VDRLTGSVAGTPSSFGTFTAVLQAQDSWSSSRVVTGAMTITVAPSALVVMTTTLPAAGYRTTYQATLSASGGTGLTSWTLARRALPAGLTLSSNGSISGSPTGIGTFAFTVRATDAGWSGNTALQPLAITVGAREIVLNAADASVIAGTWVLVSDP